MFVGGGAHFTTPVGYIDAELFSFMSPIVFIAFGISVAAARSAGKRSRARWACCSPTR